MQSLENMQQMYVSEETMNMLLEQFMQHITLITAVSALCAIPFFFWMFRRDKKYELRIGIPQVAKAKAGRYIFIVLFSIAANIAFNSILIPVSYTHLDVYKRQCLYYLVRRQYYLLPHTRKISRM